MLPDYHTSQLLGPQNKISLKLYLMFLFDVGLVNGFICYVTNARSAFLVDLHFSVWKVMFKKSFIELNKVMLS